MPRTLKAGATRPPERNHATQQSRFDRFGWEYNHERPHEALGQRTPALLYHASPRRMPAKLAEPEYPGDGLVRRISNAGPFRSKRRQLFLSDTWLQEWVALEEIGDGCGRSPSRTCSLRAWTNELSSCEADCHPCSRSEVLPMFPVAIVCRPC
jgi:hypothetical protein